MSQSQSGSIEGLPVRRDNGLIALDGRPRVAWISDFPVEWLEDLPEEARRLPRPHPATWQRVLLGELAGAGDVELHLISIRKQASRSFSFQRGPVWHHVLKVPPFFRAPSLFWVDTLLIRRCLARVRPQLVHAWGTERGASLVATRLPYPHLTTVQGVLGILSREIRVRAYFRVMAAVERSSLRRQRVMTTASQPAAEYLRREYPQAVVHRIEHAPHPAYFQVVRAPDSRRMKFVFIGSFIYGKGADLLLEALSGLPGGLDYELQVIGRAEKTYLEQLQARTDPQVWRRIQFLQAVDVGRIARLLEQATMLIFPSRSENSPNAVKEAVVAGVPVVASRVGSVPEYVLAERNGVLVAPGDAPALAEGIQKALQDPRFSQGRVCTETLDRIRGLLRPARMAQSFREVYRQTLGEGGPPD